MQTSGIAPTDDASLAQRRRLLRWLGLFGTVVVLLVTTSSAFLRVSAAGLGCEDWPACYARSDTANEQPSASRPSLVRLVHRLSASLAGAAVLGIGLIALTQPRRFRRELAIFAVLALTTLGLATLGRATPGALVPAVAMGNVLGGMLMAALLFHVALASGNDAAPARAGLRAAGWLALALTFATIGLGVLTSASFSGLACTGLPLCTESGFPGAWSYLDLDPWRPAAGSPSIHMAHRAATLLVAVSVAGFAWRVGRLGTAGQRMRHLLLGVLSIQILLGIVLVRFSLPLALAVAHNLGAAALLLALVATQHTVTAAGKSRRS